MTNFDPNKAFRKIFESQQARLEQLFAKGDLMKLRLISGGPEDWQFCLIDDDTGKIIPVHPNFKLVTEDKVTYLEAKIILWEADIDIALHDEPSS